jgi:hypothetical protein
VIAHASRIGQHDVIGTEHCLLSGDGYLMSVTKGRKPPDLRYFERRKGDGCA